MSFAWTFQGGRRIVKTISSTAGNVTTDLSPGSGKRWLVLRGYLTFETGATAGNRYPLIFITDGSNNVGKVAAHDVMTENSSGAMIFGEAQSWRTNVDADADMIGIRPILLEGSDTLRIRISSGLAEDSYSGYVVVLEVDV